MDRVSDTARDMGHRGLRGGSYAGPSNHCWAKLLVMEITTYLATVVAICAATWAVFVATETVAAVNGGAILGH